jgi:hypothetical protein
MEVSTLAAVTQRLEQLERSHRRLKSVAACAVVAVAMLAVMGQARPPAQTVEAQEFVVKDPAGTVRARLGAYASGTSLTLYHEAGRATLMVSNNKAQGGAHLSLADAAGKIKGLMLLNQETTGLYLSPVDATGPPRSPRVVFEVLSQGTGGFAVYDRNGQTRALFGAITEDGNSVGVVQDKEGAVVWKAP